MRDGHYLLRSNLTAGDPSVLWARYVQLTQRYGCPAGTDFAVAEKNRLYRCLDACSNIWIPLPTK